MPSLQSWMGHASHCNSYNFKTKILKKSDFIYDEQKDYGVMLSDIGYDNSLKSCMPLKRKCRFRACHRSDIFVTFWDRLLIWQKNYYNLSCIS